MYNTFWRFPFPEVTEKESDVQYMSSLNILNHQSAEMGDAVSVYENCTLFKNAEVEN